MRCFTVRSKFPSSAATAAGAIAATASRATTASRTIRLMMILPFVSDHMRSIRYCRTLRMHQCEIPAVSAADGPWSGGHDSGVHGAAVPPAKPNQRRPTPAALRPDSDPADRPQTLPTGHFWQCEPRVTAHVASSRPGCREAVDHETPPTHESRRPCG